MCQAARISKTLASELGQPDAAFSHESMSAWLAGIRTPRPRHRHLLASILQVPIEDLNRACDGFSQVDPNAILTTVLVHVYGNDRSFEYPLTIKKTLDLSRPAVYKNWAEMFHPEPAPLTTHFHRLQAELFGWIPNTGVSPMVLFPQTLIPLNTQNLRPDQATALQKRIWFIYTPEGQLDVGFAFQQGRTLVLSKAGPKGMTFRKYPLARVDLVGHAIQPLLFHVKRVPAAESKQTTIVV